MSDGFKNQDPESRTDAPEGSPENPLELRFPVAIRRAGSGPPRLARKKKTRSAARSGKGKSKSAAGKTAKKTSGGAKKRKRPSGKRDEVRTPTGTFYAKRTAGGRFKEMAEKGRSLAADRRKKAKKTVSSGYGDQGDRSAKRK
jgi:hypothetical protein